MLVSLMEAAGVPAAAMPTAEFRHGPLELAGPRLTLLIFEGPGQTASLNRDLAVEAAGYGARVLWLQDGIVNEEAAEKARRAGLIVIMDRCMARDHRRLMGSR